MMNGVQAQAAAYGPKEIASYPNIAKLSSPLHGIHFKIVMKRPMF